MNNTRIYTDIATRTSGDVYIGVVGPVRAGKSTFIKKFMETLVLPEIKSEGERSRARDEMPQSASGKTVMTTEPKFVPENAVTLTLSDSAVFNVKMIDCVGYIVDGAGGLKEDGQERMVMTPWSASPLPFETAAEMGTKKVIDDHATIGIMLTTDGSIGELPRDAYEESENRVIRDLKACGKPFVIVLNSMNPDSDTSVELAIELERRHSVPVALINCLELDEKDIEHIMELCLFEFPVTELEFKIPSWLRSLSCENPIRAEIENSLKNCAESITSVSSIHDSVPTILDSANIKDARVLKTDLSNGKTVVEIILPDGLFFKALSEKCSRKIESQSDLLLVLEELSEMAIRFEKIKDALDKAEDTGYGIVVPQIDDLVLEEPEIIKQSGGYGVKLKACADSIHMIRAKIKTEINPIVGSEKQSEEMVKFLLNEFEENPRGLWESNMFGKSLYCLVNEGLQSKLEHMPEESRQKIGQTLQKIVNEGSNGLICIIL